MTEAQEATIAEIRRAWEGTPSSIHLNPAPDEHVTLVLEDGPSDDYGRYRIDPEGYLLRATGWERYGSVFDPDGARIHAGRASHT